jgi:predicted RNA methylase
MTQLSFWKKPGLVDSAGTASQAASRPSDLRDDASALKCRSAAADMQKYVDAKHSSANRMLALPATRKRIQDADCIRREAIRLEQVQRTLLRLAEMHEKGMIDPDLRDLKTRGAIESALFTRSGDSSIRILFNSVAQDEHKSDKILRWTKEASLMRIPGFFPTPGPVSEQLIAVACIEPGNRILEPSAGSGSLIDAVRQSYTGVHVTYCEINCFLLDLLREKYDGSPDIQFLGRDFLEIDPRNREERFDRIIMNPPFEQGQDIDHVLHACQLLTPKGILTAIVSAGAFHRKDKKVERFRRVLEESKAFVQQLPNDSFKSSGTMAQCRLVRLAAQMAY